MYLILLATSWTLACQAPLSMGFPRQEYWSALLFPSLGDLPDPGIKPASPALAGRSFTTEPPDYAPTHSRWVRPTLQVQVSGSPHKLFPLTGIPSPPFPSMLAEIHLHLKDLDSMPLASPPNNHETFQDRCSFPSFPDAQFREPGAFIHSLAFFDDDCSLVRGGGIESHLRSEGAALHDLDPRSSHFSLIRIT